MKLRFALVISLLSMMPLHTGVSQDLATVVVNHEAIMEGKISSEGLSIRELIDIFTRKKTYWEDRTEIVVVTQKTSSIPNQQFLVEVLGLTPYQYRSRLQRNIYQGRATPPIEVSTEEEMFEKILENKQAIGYLYNYILLRNNERLVIINVTN